MTKALHTATEKALSQLKDRSPSCDKLSVMEEGSRRKRSKSKDIDSKESSVIRKLSPTLSEDWVTPAPSPSIPPRLKKNLLTAKKSTDSGDENWYGTSSSTTSVPGTAPMAASDSVPSVNGNVDESSRNEDEEKEKETVDAFVVDDEFNLPVSIALLLLVGYITLGAFLFTFWEDWNLFEAFYFIFVSISTIGFGDYVPQHPMFMMASFVYLLFGLALTSMCINVTQEALATTLTDAKMKLGARMGLEVSNVEEVNDGEVNKPKVELAGVHNLQVMPTPPPRLKRKPSTVPGDEIYYRGTDV